MIVLDASVLIAALAREDVNHAAADAFLRAAGGGLLVNTVTLGEVLVSPAREGRLDAVLATLDDLGVAEAPLPQGAARSLAVLRATTRLKMPECCVLLTATDRGGGVTLATFDAALRRAAEQEGIPVEPTP